MIPQNARATIALRVQFAQQLRNGGEDALVV
jgi:hypothetical protein